MEMKSVTSSSLSAIGYDSETKELKVQFKRGAVYVYHDVEPLVYDVIMQSESIGSALNKIIQKQGYKYTKEN